MFLVYGLQKSGISITKLLEKKNIKFKIWDDDLKVRKLLQNKYNSNIFYNSKNDNFNNFKKIFVTPGVSFRQKKFQIKNKNFQLNRDLNLYLSFLENQKIIAVTGTNGKSTTTKLIGEILKKNKIKTFVGGNIGEPLCNSIISKNKFNFHVIELSSFQLEAVTNLETKISIITNLASDHLDRYNNLIDYINQKKNIITKNGINLFSLDDKYSKKLFLQKNIKNKISFSTFNKSADVFMNEDCIIDNYFKKNKKLYVKNISKDLKGDFNYQNILLSYICSKLLKLPEKNFLNVIKNFNGLPYRAKVIYKDKKTNIINNSKSTNITSAINLITNYNQIYLILGGIAKEKNFELLLKYKDRIKYVYVYGKSANLIEKKLERSLIVKKFIDLESVIKQIKKDVSDNHDKSNILFAPACSSYDQYKNFEERGKQFSELISNNFKKK